MALACPNAAGQHGPASGGNSSCSSAGGDTGPAVPQGGTQVAAASSVSLLLRFSSCPSWGIKGCDGKKVNNTSEVSKITTRHSQCVWRFSKGLLMRALQCPLGIGWGPGATWRSEEAPKGGVGFRVGGRELPLAEVGQAAKGSPAGRQSGARLAPGAARRCAQPSVVALLAAPFYGRGTRSCFPGPQPGRSQSPHLLLGYQMWGIVSELLSHHRPLVPFYMTPA